ncbi:LLM class flavin-dependent oxidoreductase [Corynebacterium sp. CCM 9185]|uniref:LLM class flavin-dependent oxidoreductase n=1 Tax=Corynebacterium marambiense TaxID=2765364 RepID=A0ABS0VWN5_9CORY|nr:LLM class flavin-dependent oxidoreductase [Corynebacterium marambiense]MBI9001155.1 LLM class flavin-dependent oxidoreductase [Corynebacterium marambiense]MCK7663716.1 LLM class flavin-dependent oxidoreductase [Corynebacterium marambiense]MCX7542864.1 LLM class flavin-dependent oxidoreductase [Corynebacterium marambiense]
MRSRPPALSVLDLVPVSAGSGPGEAIRAACSAARTAERYGYRRYWLAEHHNSPALACSATTILMGAVAAATDTIRVGSGGIMLPNHAPLRVAEDLGTLAVMFPGRIDCGLGRAPGTDPRTAARLRRGSADLADFTRDVTELHDYLGPASGAPGETAVIGRGAGVELFVLGSSTGGARTAAELGLPFSFASHFAPDHLHEALAVYRENFNPEAPTAQVDEPWVSAAVNVMAAETTADARCQLLTLRQSFAGVLTGKRGPLVAPGDVAELHPILQSRVNHSLRVTACGTAAEVADQLIDWAGPLGLDEIITVTYAHDPVVRRISLALVGEEWGRRVDRGL